MLPYMFHMDESIGLQHPLRAATVITTPTLRMRKLKLGVVQELA